MCYYTGYLYKDILDNFPGRTSKKIFRGYREFLNNKRLVFTQRKFEDGGYDYYVQKVRYVKIK